MNKNLPPHALPPAHKQLQKSEHLRRYLQKGRVPWRQIDLRPTDDLCDESQWPSERLGVQNGQPFPLRRYLVVDSHYFRALLQNRFKASIRDSAVDRLHRDSPHLSARSTPSLAQYTCLFALFSGYIWAYINSAVSTLILTNVFITTYFVAVIGYRFFLLVMSFNLPPPRQTDLQLNESDLPVITILLPLYRDASSLAPLARAIDNLNYPRSKLDVKLLLEPDDKETANEAERLGLTERYDLIVVPEYGPKTKPKACNVGVQLALGDLVVIYDAEDQPETDQLLKAAAGFHDAPSDLACLQAKLNYYNRNDNWLTRLFTLGILIVV